MNTLKCGVVSSRSRRAAAIWRGWRFITARRQSSAHLRAFSSPARSRRPEEAGRSDEQHLGANNRTFAPFRSPVLCQVAERLGDIDGLGLREEAALFRVFRICHRAPMLVEMGAHAIDMLGGVFALAVAGGVGHVRPLFERFHADGDFVAHVNL